MRAPQDLGEDLARWMADRGLTQHAFCGLLREHSPPVIVSQPWLSRILKGDFRRTSGKVGQVLAYANIGASSDRARDSGGEKLIAAAIEVVWDGTAGGARAVARILLGAAELRRRSR